MNKNFLRLATLVSVVIASPALASVNLHFSPYSSTSTGAAALSLGLGVETFKNEGQFIVNFIRVQGIASYANSGNPDLQLATGFWGRVLPFTYLGGRTGLIIPKSNQDPLAFGAISFRYRNPEHMMNYDLEVGLSGAPYSSFAIGWSFF